MCPLLLRCIRASMCACCLRVLACVHRGLIFCGSCSSSCWHVCACWLRAPVYMRGMRACACVTVLISYQLQVVYECSFTYVPTRASAHACFCECVLLCSGEPPEAQSCFMQLPRDCVLPSMLVCACLMKITCWFACEFVSLRACGLRSIACLAPPSSCVFLWLCAPVLGSALFLKCTMLVGKLQ